MAPKNKDANKGKGKGKAVENEGTKLKSAQSINVRHILVGTARDRPFVPVLTSFSTAV
jgi:hypothetical protein